MAPKDYKDGVMQDVHWAGGLFGYFPTYTLGNLYAAQFFQKAEAELGPLEPRFARGEFQPFLDWTRARIHAEEAASAPGSWWNGSRGRPRAPGPSWPTWRKSTPPSTADAVPGT